MFLCGWHRFSSCYFFQFFFCKAINRTKIVLTRLSVQNKWNILTFTDSLRREMYPYIKQIFLDLELPRCFYWFPYIKIYRLSDLTWRFYSPVSFSLTYSDLEGPWWMMLLPHIWGQNVFKKLEFLSWTTIGMQQGHVTYLIRVCVIYWLVRLRLNLN